MAGGFLQFGKFLYFEQLGDARFPGLAAAADLPRAQHFFSRRTATVGLRFDNAPPAVVDESQDDLMFDGGNELPVHERI